MTRQGWIFSVVAAVIALVVGGLGALVVAPASRPGVLVGAACGLAVQLLSFWAIAVWLFPGKGLLAYGLGLLGRMAAFGIVALLVIPAAGLGLAPTLFSLAGVFWATTLVEPLCLRTRTQTIS